MIKNFKDIHIDRVMDIWIKANIKAHSFIAEEYWRKNYDVVKKQYMPIAKTFVCEEDGAVRGFISILEDSFIGALFVDVEYQGQGIGKMLIDYCKDRYEELSLAVYAENLKAVDFYKKCGFSIVKEQANEDSGHSEYIMKWTRNI